MAYEAEAAGTLTISGVMGARAPVGAPIATIGDAATRVADVRGLLEQPARPRALGPGLRSGARPGSGR